MILYKKDERLEKIIDEMKEISKSKKFEDKYIRKLISMQKGELSVKSEYYAPANIAEGNWSLTEDRYIKSLDKDYIDLSKKVDMFDVIYGLEEFPDKEYKKKCATEYQRKHDSEYEYIFIPSYYAVKILILYYIKDRENAKKVYNLKNAVVQRKGKKFYGGLPFILKYIDFILKHSEGNEFKDVINDFKDFFEMLFDYNYELEDNNIFDDFINDIINCIENSYYSNLILEMRIDHFNKRKERYYIDFNKGTKEDNELLLNYELIGDFKILKHRDLRKDFKHLQPVQRKIAYEKIRKTPKYPNNDYPTDSEKLTGNLKGWLSQRISKKDRLVYKIEEDKKIVYIATVCGHYENAEGRSKSIVSYS